MPNLVINIINTFLYIVTFLDYNDKIHDDHVIHDLNNVNNFLHWKEYFWILIIEGEQDVHVLNDTYHFVYNIFFVLDLENYYNYNVINVHRDIDFVIADFGDLRHDNISYWDHVRHT